ncbi:hypothetical protein [Microcoleus vaginatus]
MPEVQPREIQRYVAVDGQVPFDNWYNSLRDSKLEFRLNSY